MEEEIKGKKFTDRYSGKEQWINSEHVKAELEWNKKRQEELCEKYPNTKERIMNLLRGLKEEEKEFKEEYLVQYPLTPEECFKKEDNENK